MGCDHSYPAERDHRRFCTGACDAVSMTGPRILGALIVAGCLGLAACTSSSPTPPEPSSMSATLPASEVAAPPSAPPGFRPTLSADENKAFFDQTNQQTIATDPNARGRQLVDALVAAGVNASSMTLSADETTQGSTVDALFWSVKLGNSCLIGQYRPLEQDPNKPKYLSGATNTLSNGQCLLGTPHPIDW